MYLMICAIVQEGLPDGVAIASIQGGFATLRSDNGAYEAKLTLVPAPVPPEASEPSACLPDGTPEPGTTPRPDHGRRQATPGATPGQAGKAAKAAAQPPKHAAAAADADGAAGIDAEGEALPLENGDVIMAASSPRNDGAVEHGDDTSEAQFGTDGPDKWRWRLAGIDVLPGKCLAQGSLSPVKSTTV